MENIDKFDDLDFYDNFFKEIGEPLYDDEDCYCLPIFSEFNEDLNNAFFETILIY